MGFRDLAVASHTLYCQNKSVLALSVFAVTRGREERQVRLTAEEGACLLL